MREENTGCCKKVQLIFVENINDNSNNNKNKDNGIQAINARKQQKLKIE